jgi:small ligand-binding sensory domain FIST
MSVYRRLTTGFGQLKTDFMLFHASMSEDESTPDAAAALVADGQAAIPGPDLAFVFFTAHHTDQAEALLEKISRDLSPEALIGVSAEGIIGPDREIERAPGISLLLAKLPGVNVHPFHIAKAEWRDLLDDPQALKERLGAGDQTRALIALGDPFTTPTNQFLPAIDEHCPGMPVIGGMASAARSPGENALFYNDALVHEGMVGVSLSGELAVQTVVSQGCRPFGKTLVITKSKDNVIQTLGGKPALQALRDALLEMPEPDRQLLQNGLFVGRAISEYKETFDRGDFLVRNVMNVDNDSGAIAVGDYVKTGQTIRFHVRDAATATEDLNEMLSAGRVTPPAGGLLFSCNGRGTRLFDQPSHDVQAANRMMPRMPIAGFFAAGELGPVSGQNFIHGHTASFALFRAR